MFSLVSAGINAFDLFTRRRAYAGTIVQQNGGYWLAYFNMNTTKGSQRKFATAADAVAHIYARRVKKGWGV